MEPSVQQDVESPLILTYVYNGDSHHTIPSKYSVIGTLHHRAQTICSNPQLMQQEEEQQYNTLTKGKYPGMGPQ